jgi:hypothetical protein
METLAAPDGRPEPASCFMTEKKTKSIDVFHSSPHNFMEQGSTTTLMPGVIKRDLACNHNNGKEKKNAKKDF